MEKELKRIADIRVELKDNSNFRKGRWVTDSEGSVLFSLARLIGAKECFESGTANGFSACWMAAALPKDGVVHTFDPVNRIKVWDYVEGLKDLQFKINFHQECFDEGFSFIPPSDFPRLYFIDGDHGYMAVTGDWNVISPFLKSGDVIAFHDVRDKKVKQAIRTIRKELKDHTFSILLTPRKMGVLKIG